MSDEQKLNTTRVVLEIEVQSYGTPESTIAWLQAMLPRPAVTDVKVLRAESNFQLHKPPSDSFTPVIHTRPDKHKK